MQLNSTYYKKKSLKGVFPFFKNLNAIQIGLIGGLVLFEIFNFDTSRFALDSILGDQLFAGVSWSDILAIAFCSIDSLSLVNMFGPDVEAGPKDWLLLGAWLIGATLNTSLTWWSVSIIMLESNVGNEVLTREELLFFAPIIVAALVLLTRIALIGTLVFASSKLPELPKPKARPRTHSRQVTRRDANGKHHQSMGRPVRAEIEPSSNGHLGQQRF